MQHAFELKRKLTILDAIKFITKSWEMVQKESIIKCFKNCGFHKNDTNVDDLKKLNINIEELENISIIGINSDVTEFKECTPNELIIYLINEV